MHHFEVRITPISEEAKKKYEPVLAEVDAYAFSGVELGLQLDGEDAAAFPLYVAGDDYILAAVHELLVTMREVNPELVDAMLRSVLNGEKLEEGV